MTTTLARRSSGSMVSELLDWLEQGTPAVRGFGLAPTVRVEDFTEDDTYVLRAEMPGIDPDKDVTVKLDGDVLTIRGERREEQKDKNHREFHYGAFSRSIRLPQEVQADQVKASYKDGVLEVRVPTSPSQAQPVVVPIERVAAEKE